MTTSPPSASRPDARVTVEVPSRLLAAGVWSVHTPAGSGPAGSPVPLPAGDCDVELRGKVRLPFVAADLSLRIPVTGWPGAEHRIRLPLVHLLDEPEGVAT